MARIVFTVEMECEEGAEEIVSDEFRAVVWDFEDTCSRLIYSLSVENAEEDE